MPVAKLSLSLDRELAEVVRREAAEEGTSVSAWLVAAAEDRIRNRLLRRALDELYQEIGPIGVDERAALVSAARTAAIETGVDEKAGA